MKLRPVVVLLPLLASPVVWGGLVPHAALASSTLAYEIQASSGSGSSFFDLDGSVGHNSGTPVYADFFCAGHFGSTNSGWSASGNAATRTYASEPASEADTRAPTSVGVTLTDAAGDTVKITGAGVFDNNQDTLVAGSFKITYTPSSGTPATCTISNSGGQSFGEAEME